jgi:hypothetical protein
MGSSFGFRHRLHDGGMGADRHQRRGLCRDRRIRGEQLPRAVRLLLYDIDYTKRWFFFVCTKMSPAECRTEAADCAGRVSVRLRKRAQLSCRSSTSRAGMMPTRLPAQRQRRLPALYRNDAARCYVAMMTTFNTDRSFRHVGCRDPRPGDEHLLVERRGHGLERTTALFGLFDPQFADRMQKADHTPGGSTIAATPPFLKLSFALTYCAPFASATPIAAAARSCAPYAAGEHDADRAVAGQASPHDLRRALLVDTQGVSMGVDFLTMRPLPSSRHRRHGSTLRSRRHFPASIGAQ